MLRKYEVNVPKEETDAVGDLSIYWQKKVNGAHFYVYIVIMHVYEYMHVYTHVYIMPYHEEYLYSSSAGISNH